MAELKLVGVTPRSSGFSRNPSSDLPSASQTLSPARTPRPIGALAGRGQAMVEFAMIATVALIVLLIGIQFALLGQAALAVSQIAFYGARYASVNPAADQTAVKTQMIAQGSPTITGDPTKLTVTMTCSPQACASRIFGTQVTINVSYDAHAQLVLPSPFLGITFPTTLTSQETAMSE